MSNNSNLDIWIAGAFAAFTVDLLVYPLDTLKTRIQSPDYRKIYVHEATGAVNKAVLFRGLYQGLGSVILATLPSSGAFFTTYEGVKSVLSDKTSSVLPKPVIHALASASAELVSCAILTPAEVIKQNAQMVTESSVAGSQVGATRQVVQRFMQNPLALWRGYSALAGRNLPFTALQFPMFERFKHGLLELRDSNTKLSLTERGTITALAAGSAGAISAVVTTPIDVVKTRIMLAAATTFADQSSGSSSPTTSSAGTSAKSAAKAVKDGKLADAVGQVARSAVTASSSKPKALSTAAITREILATSGWKGLWRGGALRGVWTFLGSGLYLGVYEAGRLYLEDSRKASE